MAVNSSNSQEQIEEYERQKDENLEKIKLQIVAENDAELNKCNKRQMNSWRKRKKIWSAG